MLGNMVRSACTDAGALLKQHWFVLDSPLQVEWLDDLCTALDGSRTLTLCTGERIHVPQQVCNRILCKLI